MKKLLDGAVLGLGTLGLFGLPILAMGMAAWLGDRLMGMLHLSASAMQSGLVQAGTVILLFATSAGGLALAALAAAALWSLLTYCERRAALLEPPPGRALRVVVQARPVHGRIETPIRVAPGRLAGRSAALPIR